MSRRLRTFAFLVVAVALTACSEPMTAENYEKLKAGMSREDVEAIFGSGEDKEGTGKFGAHMGKGAKVQWKSGDKWLIVTFRKNGTLATRSKGGF